MSASFMEGDVRSNAIVLEPRTNQTLTLSAMELCNRRCDNSQKAFLKSSFAISLRRSRLALTNIL